MKNFIIEYQTNSGTVASEATWAILECVPTWQECIAYLHDVYEQGCSVRIIAPDDFVVGYVLPDGDMMAFNPNSLSEWQYVCRF